MPAYNPFIDTGANVESWDGSPLVTLSTLYGTVDTVGGAYVQNAGPGPLSLMQGSVSDLASQQGMNAAGTSENVAMDVAVIVLLSGLFVWALRKTGFRFVVAGGVG